MTDLPCDVELPTFGEQPCSNATRSRTVRAEAPAVADVGHTSWYLTRPCRSFAEAVRDISKRRDLPEWIWPELQHHRHSAVIIELAAERARRVKR